MWRMSGGPADRAADQVLARAQRRGRGVPPGRIERGRTLQLPRGRRGAIFVDWLMESASRELVSWA